MCVKFILYVCSMKREKYNFKDVLRDKNSFYLLNGKSRTAQQKFAKWLRIDPLWRKLELLEWKPYQKVLTPKQVACIIDHVGEPDMEMWNHFNFYFNE